MQKAKKSIVVPQCKLLVQVVLGISCSQYMWCG